MSKSLPEFLYKFRHFSKEHIQAALNNELWFATSDTFNDPFDSNTKAPIIWFTDKSFTQSANNQDEYDPIIIETLKAERRAQLKKPNNELSLELKSYKDKISKLLSDSYIFCLSTDIKNHIIWSHYANYHKGFCIKYKAENLINDIELSDHNIITYTNNPLDHLSIIQEGSRKNPLNKIFFQKSLDWEYEGEYRLIHKYLKEGDLGKAVPVNHSDNAIDTIIFGMEARDEDRLFLMKILSGKDIKFRQMINNGFSYDLELSNQELSTDKLCHIDE